MGDLPSVIVDPLQRYFDPSLDQSSPLVQDYVRTVHHDEKHGEYVSYDPFDSASYQKELGPVDNWSLDALLKAGVDPRFGVHTSSPSRLDSLGVLNQFDSIAENLFNSINEN